MAIRVVVLRRARSVYPTYSVSVRRRFERRFHFVRDFALGQEKTALEDNAYKCERERVIGRSLRGDLRAIARKPTRIAPQSRDPRFNTLSSPSAFSSFTLALSFIKTRHALYGTTDVFPLISK